MKINFEVTSSCSEYEMKNSIRREIPYISNYIIPIGKSPEHRRVKSELDIAREKSKYFSYDKGLAFAISSNRRKANVMDILTTIVFEKDGDLTTAKVDVRPNWTNVLMVFGFFAFVVGYMMYDNYIESGAIGESLKIYSVVVLTGMLLAFVISWMMRSRKMAGKVRELLENI